MPILLHFVGPKRPSGILIVSLLLNSFPIDSNSSIANVVCIGHKIQKKLSKILKKADDITTMTPSEYEIYIDDYTKKSKYPDISKWKI